MATSRIQEARLRATHAKRVLATLAAAAFAAAVVLARETHPGATASSGVPRAQAPAAAEEDDGGGLDFGTGSVSPSFGTAPQVQTRAS
jgi:hypothetical protein